MATHSWILSLDSDEMPDETLLNAIAQLPFPTLASNHLYTIKRISFFEGKKIEHGSWGRDRVTRLYNKAYTQWNNAAVHEALEVKQDTDMTMLKGILLHYTADDYDSFLEKNKKYAQLSAEKYFARNKKSPLWKRLFAPSFSFIKEYIFQGGFLDGQAGFKIARINAQYTRWKYVFLKEKYQEISS